ncbi:sensor histidine kinase [Flavobacterium sedimenticola]|uniref:Histidine kinase n=1 Tax=Flavobacterium sedimenticola TaxID=3043286 RepID=A0ABT6XS59_9FLAO|nr:sensor histidine kinase [Flavobacterium sedimenticola]MDI9257915.1 histidine kinase [Flavobacterium sedimenticola]
MKKFIDKIYVHRYFILFIMLYSYVQSIYSRISVIDEINLYTFTPEAFFFTPISTGILFLIIMSFIKLWQKSEMLYSKEILKIFVASMVMYPLTMQLLGLIIAYSFDNIEQNFNQNVFLKTTFRFFLDGFVYGSFILTYYYFNKNKNYQKQLSNSLQALSESKIHQLKTQLNPHFLFNNLNVLDQLIEEDKNKASDFLNEFADIYRYVLHVSDKKLVSLSDELSFARQYFKLIEHKYGLAYQLQIKGTANGFIVPLTLQLLIENAIQHNLGTLKNPVCIVLEVNETISVKNNFISKTSTKQTSGRSLQNIKEQYHLLTNNPIEINKNDTHFSVIIPIIQSHDKNTNY